MHKFHCNQTPGEKPNKTDRKSKNDGKVKLFLFIYLLFPVTFRIARDWQKEPNPCEITIQRLKAERNENNRKIVEKRTTRTKRDNDNLIVQ